MPVACGRGYSLLRITKEDTAVICLMVPLSDELNAFYACFDNNNIIPCVWAPTELEDWVINLPLQGQRK
jgi:hypothetical protein